MLTSLRTKYLTPGSKTKFKENPRSRKLGYLERYICAAHDVKVYNGVVITGEFTASNSSTKLGKKELYPALKEVILNHPSLTVAIKNPSTLAPYFEIPDRIDLDEHVRFFDTPKNEQERLQVYSDHLSKKFENVDARPPWRVFVLPMIDDRGTSPNSLPNDSMATIATETVRYEIALAFHHTIGDGLSGTIFLSSLQEALNRVVADDEQESQDTRYVTLPENTKLPLSIEKALKLPLSVKFLGVSVLEEFGFLDINKGCWTGPNIPKDVGAPDFVDLRTKLQRQWISKENVAKLLKECRSHGTSVTCMISIIALAALSRALPASHVKVDNGDCGGLDQNGNEFSRLRVALARNLRPNAAEEMGITRDTMGNFVCTHDMHLDRKALTTSDKSEDAYSQDLDLLWSSAVKLKADLNKFVANGTKDLNPGLLRYAGNIRKYFSQKAGRPRLHSLDVSSLLSHKPSTPKDCAWQVSNLGFSQSVLTEGAPINLSTVSYQGDALCLSWAWCEMNVTTEIIEKLMKGVATYVDLIVGQSA